MSMKFIGRTLFAISIVLMFFYFLIKRHKDEIVSLKAELQFSKNKYDSLLNESAMKDVEIQGYKMAIQRAGNEMNDECFDQLESILNPIK